MIAYKCRYLAAFEFSGKFQIKVTVKENIAVKITVQVKFRFRTEQSNAISVQVTAHRILRQDL